MPKIVTGGVSQKLYTVYNFNIYLKTIICY